MTQALDPRHNLGPSLEHVRDELAHALPGSERAVDAFGQVSELMHQVPRAFDDCSWLRSHGGEAAELMCDLHDQVALDFATVSDAIASIDRLESALQGFGGDLGDLADELLPAIDGVEHLVDQRIREVEALVSSRIGDIQSLIQTSVAPDLDGIAENIATLRNDLGSALTTLLAELQTVAGVPVRVVRSLCTKVDDAISALPAIDVDLNCHEIN
jgi:hypothetical protein